MFDDNLDADDINTKLKIACKKGNLEFVKSFFQDHSSYNIDIQDKDGFTCLHDTAVHTCQFIVITKLLLEHGASVNIKDNEGNTPMHAAVLFHCVENVKLMMNYNPDLSLVNNDNATAVDFAENEEDTEILCLLLGKKYVENMSQKTKSKPKRKRVNQQKKAKTIVPISQCNSPSILKKRKRNKLEENSFSQEHESISKFVKFNFTSED